LAYVLAISSRDNVNEVIDISRRHGLKAYILGEVSKENFIKINIPRVGEVLI